MWPSWDVVVLMCALRRVMAFGADRIAWVASRMPKAWASEEARSGWEMSGLPSHQSKGLTSVDAPWMKMALLMPAFSRAEVATPGKSAIHDCVLPTIVAGQAKL